MATCADLTQNYNIVSPVGQGCIQHLPANVLLDALQLCFENGFNQFSDVCIQSLFHYSCADLLCASCHTFCFLIYCLPVKKKSLISTPTLKIKKQTNMKVTMLKHTICLLVAHESLKATFCPFKLAYMCEMKLNNLISKNSTYSISEMAMSFKVSSKTSWTSVVEREWLKFIKKASCSCFLL